MRATSPSSELARFGKIEANSHDDGNLSRAIQRRGRCLICSTTSLYAIVQVHLFHRHLILRLMTSLGMNTDSLLRVGRMLRHVPSMGWGSAWHLIFRDAKRAYHTSSTVSTVSPRFHRKSRYYLLITLPHLMA